MTAIVKREFKAYFHSFIGFLFIAAILCITGIYVTVYNLLSGLPNLSYALSGVIFIFIISVPILTMRVIAEERHQKTDQLILTAPISVGKIVLGKFFALGMVFTLPVLLVCCYPLLLSIFGTVAMQESYVAILAFYLYGLTCIAIGIFISSLTESQVIAAVISFGVLFLGYVMAGICSMISSTGNWITKILGAFDLVSRFTDLTEGTLDLKSIIYFLSIILLMLFMTIQSIQKRRYSVSVKKIKKGVYSTVMIGAVLAVTVLVNFLAAKLPVKYTSFDVTAEGLFSITKETQQLLSSLQEEVTIYVLAGESTKDSTLEKTIEQYEAGSKYITVSYVDPAVNPKFYSKYSDTELTTNSVIVESSKRSKVVDYNSIYETSIDYNTYSETVTGYDGEGQLTSAVNYVISDNMPKLYLIEGHGELGLETDFYEMIAKANIEYETINLLQKDSIPEDAACIIINAPTSDFSEDDADKVLNYLKAGGNALLISTWTEETMENYEKILAYYEVTVEKGLVMEGKEDAYYQSPFYILPEIAYDAVTAAVSDSYIFAPFAQGMVLPEETGEALSLKPLLSTSEASYARAEVNNTTDYSRQEGDKSGPFVLGVSAVKTEGEAESAALIYTSESIFTDAADSMVSGANKKLFASSLSELVEETEGIAIPVKSYEVSYLMIPQIWIIVMGLSITIALPLVILGAGFIMWFRRRRA